MRGVVVLPARRRPVRDDAIRLVAIGPIDVAVREAPGDDEAHRLAAAGRDGDAGAERAVLGLQAHVLGGARLVVVPLRQPAGAGEFLPVDGEVVEPLAAEVMVGVVDIVGIGGDGQIAALRLRQVGIGRGQVQAADAVLLRESVDAAVRAVISERAGERVGQLVRGIVDDLELEHRDRHRAVAVVVRDERARAPSAGRRRGSARR